MIQRLKEDNSLDRVAFALTNIQVYFISTVFSCEPTNQTPRSLISCSMIKKIKLNKRNQNMINLLKVENAVARSKTDQAGILKAIEQSKGG